MLQTLHIYSPQRLLLAVLQATGLKTLGTRVREHYMAYTVTSYMSKPRKCSLAGQPLATHYGVVGGERLACETTGSVL